MKKLLLTITIALGLNSFNAYAQLPNKVLVGYWENWGNIRLTEVNDAYNVICLSFLEADVNSNSNDNVVGDLEFTPSASTGGSFGIQNDIITLQSEGKVVLMSIGGANGSFKLNNSTDITTFVEKVKTYITVYKVDGIDIDLEGQGYLCNSSWHSMDAQVQHMQNLSDGVKELLTWYQGKYGKKMILTMAPEINYTVGALSQWSTTCAGVFLPFIEELRDDIDLLMVQLYNAGSILGTPVSAFNAGPEYAAGTTDFIIAATEALIEGFKSKNSSLSGTYSGLPECKIAVAVPACAAAAWSGSYTTAEIEAAVKYLTGKGPQPGSRTLDNSYPNLRGLMTWSINKDAQSCGNAIANLAPRLFDYDSEAIECLPNTESTKELSFQLLNFYPNPTTGTVTVESDQLIGKNLFITNIEGKVVKSIIINSEKQVLDVSNLADGIYYLRSENYAGTVVVK